MAKNHRIIIFFIAVSFIILIILVLEKTKILKPTTSTDFKNYNSNNMTISSPAFISGGLIPDEYGCHGRNINPPLSFAGVPAKAASLVLIVDDPDAPAGIWTHWLLFNIDPKTSAIVAGETPAGAQNGRNDFGAEAYGGPCPPSGAHRYYFHLYALDTAINLPSPVLPQDLSAAISDHILAQASLFGIYRH